MNHTRTIILLAPGPSMSPALAESVRGHRVGVINNCYELAPWAEFLVANDAQWWRKHPAAHNFKGRKFSTNKINGVELYAKKPLHTGSNSGLLAVDVAKSLGATRVFLLGFDMRGSHYFGQYVNGCANTPDARRAVHHVQFGNWAATNKDIEVINCTPGSALTAFPRGELAALL